MALTTVLVVALAAALAGLAALAWLAVQARRHPAVQARILLNLVDDAGAIRGVVLRARGEWLIVGHAE